MSKPPYNLDDLLTLLREMLNPLQIESEKSFTQSQSSPFGFVVGNPRSGTTLLSQWLSSFGCFSYPSNFMTRFAYASYMGALFQEMLFNEKFDPQNDFSDIKSNLNFKSDLGKSKGALAVNEFNHFYRLYTKQTHPIFLSKNKLQKVDWEELENALTLIESVFEKPFISKMTILKYNLYDLYKNINCLFFYIKRDPMFNMQSLYFARLKFHNSINKWYGSKPKEYDELKEKDVYHQIAGQIYFTDKSIQEDLKKVPKERQISIDYQNFCKNPEVYRQEIYAMYSYLGIKLKQPKIHHKKFEALNKYQLPKEKSKKMEQAYNHFIDKYGELEIK